MKKTAWFPEFDLLACKILKGA